ncbi:MAG: extracellular solute-binding protein [Limnochordia bacterium]|jgi:multiple sugar transport system substrate-binding protein
MQVKKFIRQIWMVLFVVAVGFSIASGKETIHFLGVGYSPSLVQALKQNILPEFERQHNVEVILENTTWDERVDRFITTVIGGMAPDVITTGYYAPYEEGAAGLLMPLDKYLGQWEYQGLIPEPIWESQSWAGSIYAMPVDIDVRGIVYSKLFFEQAGFDGDQTPESWDELVEWTRRLTVLGSDQQSVEKRGLFVSAHAQHLFWYMLQAGIQPVDVNILESDFDKPEAIDAAQMLLDLHLARQGDLPGPQSGGIFCEETAMSWYHPGWFNKSLAELDNPEEMVRHLGIFAPRRSQLDDPVAIGFINGLAIPQGCKNPELAWELIAYLTRKDVLEEIHKITGTVSPRVDIVPELMVWPGAEMFYSLIPYIRTTIVPPPRNRAQGQVEELLKAMYSMRIPPNRVVQNAHDLWTRLLQEWKASMTE